MRRWTVAVLLCAGEPALADVTVTPTGDHLSIRAVAAPLADVLDQLARKTGMKVSYEGSAPRHRVTLALDNRTPVEAVLGVMEAQGLNFGMRTDPSGTRVERLLVMGSAPTAGATGGPGSGHAVPTARPAPPSFPRPATFEEKEEPEPEPEPEDVPPPGVPPQIQRRPVAPPQPSMAPPVTGPQYPNSPFAPTPPPMPPPPEPPPPPPEDEEGPQ
jgi:hypothetical protein